MRRPCADAVRAKLFVPDTSACRYLHANGHRDAKRNRDTTHINTDPNTGRRLLHPPCRPKLRRQHLRSVCVRGRWLLLRHTVGSVLRGQGRGGVQPSLCVCRADQHGDAVADLGADHPRTEHTSHPNTHLHPTARHRSPATRTRRWYGHLGKLLLRLRYKPYGKR